MADTEIVTRMDDPQPMQASSAQPTFMTVAGVPVPMSLLHATFATYQPGDPPPLEVVSSQLRATQQQLAIVTAQWHSAEARLFEATADARRQAIEQENADMLARLRAAAPDGHDWRPAASRYVPKDPSE